MNAVHRLRTQHRIKTLCRVLEVNRSSYYKHYRGKPAARTLENQRLRVMILTIYNESRQRFGVNKIRQRLITEYGITISCGRVYRLMKTMDLVKMGTVKPRKPKNTINADGAYPNSLDRRFNPKAPNLVWVSDITYVRVNGKFHHICVVIDLFARKLIAWKVSAKVDDSLTIDTVRDAYRKRGCPENVLFHSDRGCQYTSRDFRKLMDELVFIQSFSKKGTPYDNAVAEAFFKYLKLEQISRRSYGSLQDLELVMFEYANFYNAARPHSFNGALTPNQREEAFAMTV